jgi:hypothetical protein
MRRVMTIVAGGVLFANGCVGGRPRPFIGSTDPAAKIPGIKQAAQSADRTKLAQLVAELASDDPAVRLYAIEALDRMTGQRFGFVYYADDEHRRPAIEQWQAWLARQGGSNSATQPASTEATKP